LTKNTYWDTRLRVARNHNTSQETLEVLSTDSDWIVRLGAAENPNTPTHVLDKLTKDKPASIIRDVVIRNPNTLNYLVKYMGFYNYLELL
jgi:hypothetical protein